MKIPSSFAAHLNPSQAAALVVVAESIKGDVGAFFAPQKNELEVIAFCESLAALCRESIECNVGETEKHIAKMRKRIAPTL